MPRTQIAYGNVCPDRAWARRPSPAPANVSKYVSAIAAEARRTELIISDMSMLSKSSTHRTSLTSIAWKASFLCPAPYCLNVSTPSNHSNLIFDSASPYISQRLLASMIGHGGREHGELFLAWNHFKTCGYGSHGQRKHSMILRRRNIWNH